MPERNCLDQLWRICLVSPEGRYYEAIDYVNQDGKVGSYRFTTNSKEQADKEFKNPRRPADPWDWPGSVGSVVLMTWKPLENDDHWSKIGERKAKLEEFALTDRSFVTAGK